MPPSLSFWWEVLARLFELKWVLGAMKYYNSSSLIKRQEKKLFKGLVALIAKILLVPSVGSQVLVVGNPSVGCWAWQY